MVHTFNSSTQKAEAGGFLRVRGQFVLHREALTSFFLMANSWPISLQPCLVFSPVFLFSVFSCFL